MSDERTCARTPRIRLVLLFQRPRNLVPCVRQTMVVQVVEAYNFEYTLRLHVYLYY